MAFVEAAEKAPRMRKLQVFATDLNDALLDKARHGLYAKSLAQDISPERLRRFFVEEEGGYRVSKALREMVVFARQNLISDPPFSRMDLISCRNLLIYLEPSLQKKALPTFHYALKPEGFLFLGASESIGGFTDLFEPVDKKHKIYSKKAAPTPAFHCRSRKSAASSRHRAGPATATPCRCGRPGEAPEGFRGELNAQREADRVTVNQFAPPGVLDQCRAASPAVPRADRRVSRAAHRQGELRRAEDGAGRLDAAAARRHQQGEEGEQDRAQGERAGQAERQDPDGECGSHSAEEFAGALLFDLVRGRGTGGRAPPRADARAAARRGRRTPCRARRRSRRVAELETELAETRDYLQSIQEQHEAANEELQASNEEVQSANEELQSINEELETSKEELESANEELTTVNEEMANRNAELNRLNSDLVNLQTSTKLAIVLLGRDLTIRRFSPQAEKQFDLLAADVGRPIGHIRHNLVLADGAESPLDLEGLIAEVIATVREQEREVRDKDGRWYSLRVRPYLTLDNKVDGAVLVLVDIDALKRGEQAHRRGARLRRGHHSHRARPAGRARRRPARPNRQRRVLQHFQGHAGRDRRPLDLSIWQPPVEHSPAAPAAGRHPSPQQFLQRLRGHARLRASAAHHAAQRPDAARPQRKPERILLGIQDITEIQSLQAVRQSEARKGAMLKSALDAIISMDHEGRFVEFNPAAEKIFGYSQAEVIGKPLVDFIIPARLRDQHRKGLAQLSSHGQRPGLELANRAAGLAGGWLGVFGGIGHRSRSRCQPDGLYGILARYQRAQAGGGSTPAEPSSR